MRRLTTRCCSAVALIALLATPAYTQTATPVARAARQTRSVDDKTPLSLFPLTPVWRLTLNNALSAPPAFRDNYAVFALEGDQIAAYDLESGMSLWLTKLATTTQPAIGPGRVFVATADALIALSLRTGATEWMQELDDELAAPLVADGERLIVANADGDIIARRVSDGVELWRRHLPRAATSAPSMSSTRVFVATADNMVVAIDALNGAVLWSRRLGGAGHDILVADDRVFLGAQDRFFYCLNAKDGEVEWRWATGADAIGLPVLDDRSVYFVSLDNVLRGLNRSSGVQRWKSALSLRPIAGPLKYRETLVIPGTAPAVDAFSTRDGKTQGRYSVTSELSATPYLFTDRSRIFPVLVTISSDIVGNATVTGATRDVEPGAAGLVPLANLEKLSDMPAPPADLAVVSALPNLTPVVPVAAP